MAKFVILYRGVQDNHGKKYHNYSDSFAIKHYNDPTEHDLNDFFRPKVVDRIESMSADGLHKITEWKVIVSSRYSDDFFYVHKYLAIQIGD